MRRYVKIFFLHFEHVLQNRDRVFVWFLISLFGPIIFLLFWNGAANGRSIEGWNFERIAAYYLLMVVAEAALISHIEEDISREDIGKGELVKYLMKPFSYYLFKFYEEVVYRIFQGFMAICVVFALSILLKKPLLFHMNIFDFILVSLIILLSFLLSFTFKMILGLVSLWIINISGFRQTIEIITLVFAGITVPLIFLPPIVEIIAKILPFAYIIYYPIVGFMGILSRGELFQVIIAQLIWLAIMGVSYKFIWNAGMKLFTAVGQ